LPVSTSSHKDDLQAVHSSLPVENGNGIQVDTFEIKVAQANLNRKERPIKDSRKGQNNIESENKNIQQKTKVLGYVPVEIVNISLKVQLVKQTYVGVASPITVRDTRDIVGYDVNAIQRDSTEQGNFDEYLQEKLAHLKGED